MTRHDAKRRIAASVRDLRHHSAADFPAVIEHVSCLAAEVVDATDVAFCFSVRNASIAVPLGGWRPLAAQRFGPNADRHERILGQWYRATSRKAADPTVSALVQTHGRARAFLRAEVSDEDTWRRSGIDTLLAESGVGDRLVMASPLAHDTELLLLTYRPLGAPAFEVADRDIMVDLATAIRGAGREIARAHGLLDGRTPLTDRERTVLRLLLLGLSERRAAARLGLTFRSLHQYVVAIYRKLNVSSRGELMASFVTPEVRENALARYAPRFGPRETQVLAGVLHGLSEKEVADAVGLSLRATHHAIAAIYRGVGVHTRAALLAKILTAAIGPPNPPTDA